MRSTSTYQALLLVVFSFFIFHASEAHASILFFDAPETVSIGDTFEVVVMLDTEGESVNAVQGEVAVTGEGITVSSVHDGGSIVPLFVTPPLYENGTVTFAGVIPGGFSGVARSFETAVLPGRVLTFVVAAEEAGEATFSWRTGEVLRNADTAEPVSLHLVPFTLSIVEGDAAGSAEPLKDARDVTPPEPFSPLVMSDPAFFDGEMVVLFTTQDTGSGVAYYEVSETKHMLVDGEEAEWVRATSPYVLHDQELRSYVYVRAVDHAGNERRTVVSPQKSFKNTDFKTILVIFFILSPLLYFFRARLLLSWRSKRSTT